MKNTKLIKIISCLAATVLLGASTLAGCKKEEHAYRWTVETEATCSTTGKRRGVCGIHAEVKEEVIPIAPDKHVYGEWQVEKPTADAEGLATKICTLNSAHTSRTVLPKITEDGAGYLSSEITKPSTSIAEGERTFVFEHADGNVEFTVTLPKRAVENVEDAVLLGSSLGHLVRSASGRYSDAKHANATPFSCYYGDDYTRVLDGGNSEAYWYTKDDEGKTFGIFAQAQINNGELGELKSDPKVVENSTDENLLGYGYSSGVNTIRGFGAEDTLLKYYQAYSSAKANGEAVYPEENLIKVLETGEYRGTFSYSHAETPHFARYSIEFELYPTGVIKTLKVNTMFIRTFLIEVDANGNQLFYKDGPKKGDIVYAEEYELSDGANQYETDGEGNIIYSGVKTDCDGNVLLDKDGKEIPRPKPLGRDTRKYYSDAHEFVVNRVLQYDEPVLKTENDVVPESPFTSEDLYIKSFNVTYGGKVVGEERVSVPSKTKVDFGIADILPTTAGLDYDPIIPYISTPTGEKQLTIHESDNSFSMTGYFDKEKKIVSIVSKYAGEVTLVFRTKGGKVVKNVNLTVEKSAPTTISAEVYAYTDADGTERHIWTQYTPESAPVTVYAGQKLYIRAKASPEEELYCDTSFKASVGTSAADKVSFTNFVEFDGGKVSEMVANTAGEYSVWLEYDKAGDVYTSFKVKVLDVPDMREHLDGLYTTRLQYFGEDSLPADLNVTFNKSASDWRRGTITAEVDGNTATYNYVFDRDTGKLTTTFVSGINGATADFEFSINEMYKLTVTHSTGFGDNKETVVLARPKTAE